MEKTLGVFVNRERVGSDSEFFSEVWQMLQSGPLITRPKRCGNYEPFSLVEEADLKTVLSSEYFTSNGRRSLCSVWSPPFDHSQFFNITILLRLKHTEHDVACEVYDWLRSSFPGEISYMGAPTQAMFDNNLELHQILNSGAAEQDLPKLRQNKGELDFFHEAG